MEKKQERTLVSAPLWKRIFAYLFDGFLAVGLGLIFYLAIGNGVMADSLGETEATKNLYKLYVDSGLFYGEPDANGEYTSSPSTYLFTADGTEGDSSSYTATPNGEYGYEAYLDIVWKYYTGFLASDDERVTHMKDDSGSDFSSQQYCEYFNRSIIGLPIVEDPSDLTSNRIGNAKYFQYALNEEGTAIDVHGKPILQDAYVAKIADEETKEETLEELLSYFLYSDSSSSVSGLYYDAAMDLQGERDGSVQTYFIEQYAIINTAAMIVTFTCFLPFQIIFFLIIPLCLPEGKTLGKLIFRLAVVRSDALRIRPLERIFRPLIVSSLGVLLFALGTTLGIMVYTLLAVVDFCALSFSRSHQALHDRICRTLVVDAKESVWFEDELAKEEYLRSQGFEGMVSFEEKAALAKLAAEDNVLDLSNINRNREEAAKMTSFDEFEKKKEAEQGNATDALRNGSQETNLHKAEDPDDSSDKAN